MRTELDARTCPVEVYFLPPRRRLGNRLGPSATTVLKVVEVAKTVAPSGAITHVEAWNAIFGTTTAWKATVTRRMTARVFIVDDVKREQDGIKNETTSLDTWHVCQSTFWSPFMHKDSSENHATHHLVVRLVTRHNVQEINGSSFLAITRRAGQIVHGSLTAGRQARPFEKKRALKFALNRVKSFIIFTSFKCCENV